MRRWAAVPVVVLVVGAAVVSCAERTPRGTGRASGGPVIAAVGDIACNSLPSEHARRCRYELLDERGVDVVLAGHEHTYQRFAPMDAFGRPDPDGIRRFVVGTGGSTYGDLPGGEAAANREAGQVRSFGVLRMELGAGGYDWAFVTAPGEPPYEDAGHADCA